jgi:hypothetical protein
VTRTDAAMTQERRAVVMLVALAGLLCFGATGCYSIDPTEQGFTIHIKNDTPSAVVIGYCKDDECDSYWDTWNVGVGEEADAAISDRGVFDRYGVISKSGRLLGCLPLKFSHAYEDVVVLASQMVPCPGSTALVVNHGARIDQDHFP